MDLMENLAAEDLQVYLDQEAQKDLLDKQVQEDLQGFQEGMVFQAEKVFQVTMDKFSLEGKESKEVQERLESLELEDQQEKK